MDPDELDQLAGRVVAESQEGDRGAFRELMLSVMTDVRLHIAARCTSPEMVEEVLQATFVTCCEVIHSYRPGGTFLPWLKAIARNRLLREYRDQARYHAAAGHALEAALARDSAEYLESEPARASDATSERVDHLRECLDALAPQTRQILERHHVHLLPLAGLAREFGRSRQAIASLLKRARRAVRACVEAKGATA